MDDSTPDFLVRDINHFVSSAGIVSDCSICHVVSNA